MFPREPEALTTASICRPDLPYSFVVCVQVVTADTFNKKLNKGIYIVKDAPDFGLKFVPLDGDSLRVFSFADASFV